MPPAYENIKSLTAGKNEKGIILRLVRKCVVPDFYGGKKPNSLECIFHDREVKIWLHFNVAPKKTIVYGYTVKGIVRNLSDTSKVAHLAAHEGAKERLQLYEANLLREGSFDSVVDGCEGVFHTASPVFYEISDPQTELIDPAVKGTINVRKSCTKVSTIKREWYALSKTLADTATWKYAEENGLDFVTIHPGLTIGRPLQPTLNSSCVGLLNFIKGKQLLPNGVYRYVDVRDVALAHVVAYENASASGRYCLVGSVANLSDAFDILKQIFPSLNLPPIDEENRPTKLPYQVSKEKAESLGVRFRPLEETLKDSVKSFRERNLITC